MGPEGEGWILRGPEAFRVPFAGPGACEAPAEHVVGGGRHLV